MIVRSVLLIVNPASRRGARQHPRVLRAFAGAGVACDAVLTRHAGHASAIAASAAGQYDAVFTLGGDGTVMEVLAALAGGERPIGILPAGTGNLIARAVAIPMNVTRAVRQLTSGTVRRVDLGSLSDGRVFAFAAGVGIDATMVERTSSSTKRMLGVLAYVLTASRASLAIDTFTLEATVDGVRHRHRATAAMVVNFGSMLNGLIHLGPEIAPNDGLLDLCVFSPANVRDALRLGWRIVRNDFSPDAAMHFVKGRHIRLETDPPRPSQADGELLGNTPLDIEVRPLAARLLVPR